MTQAEIIKKLKKILYKSDIDRDSLITRQTSTKHKNEIELLLEHINILIAELRHDAESSKRELFQIRNLLEFDE